MEKTNVMRILDQKKIAYEALTYPHEENVCVDGAQVAKLLNIDSKIVYKTLVTIGNSKHYYVFVIPVLQELDLKKCAKAVNEKSIALINFKDLLSITGYIRGGCSPIGMKKLFKTVFDISAQTQDKIIFSAGKIGYQVKVNPKDIAKLLNASYNDLIL